MTARRILATVSILAMLVGLASMIYSLHTAHTLTSRDPASSAPPVASTPVAPATIDPGSLPVVGDGERAAPEEPRSRQGGMLATITIPRLSLDSQPVIEGIRQRDLDEGLGHYPMTPMPGERGNVAIAGHRWEGPLYDFERLRVGDRIVIEGYADRGLHRWTYEVTTPIERVLPDEVWIIDPVAGHERDRMLTLTTCWPKDGSSHREYIRARLIEEN